MALKKILTYALSDNQQGIFFETLRSPHPVYISQMCMHFKGLFNNELFQQAYHLVINRHDILRAAFSANKANSNTLPIQTIYEKVDPELIYYDYSELSEAEKKQHYYNFLATDLITPFDFSQPCLMRLAIIRYSDKEHRLVWTRHHILLDGRSVKLILSELLTIYNALLNNEQWKLSPSSSYLKIKEKFCLPDLNKAAEYWQQQLGEFSQSSLLPTASKLSVIKNFSQINTKFSSNHYKELATFVGENNLTINSILQAAWGIVISHYSNNKHVIFGSVRAYPSEDVKDCAGLFINTLPMALAVNPKMKILEYLKIVREVGKQQRDYIYTSLSDIRKWCGLALNESLYQSIIDYKPYSLNQMIREEYREISCEISFNLVTPYPLAMEITNENDYLSMRLNYTSDLFTQEFAQGLLEHFQDMIKALVLYSSKTLSELSALPAVDWQSVIQWNQTQKTYPLQKTVHQFFEEQVIKTPNTIAIRYKDECLTYTRVNIEANQLAHFLIQQGVQPEALILIILTKPDTVIVSQLAVLKAGGAYVPIDANYPIERINYLINDSCAEFIICDEKSSQIIAQIVKRLGKPILLINLDKISLSQFNSSNPALTLPSSNLAYMIYTSGSTGTPKGVLVEHSSLLNMALGCIDQLKITQESRILQIASFGFDVAVAEWGMALLSGASLYLMDKAVFNPVAIMEALEIYAITTIILASPILTTLSHRNLPHLKVIAVGGESCSQAVINFWAKDRVFLNVYGITETTVCSTVSNCYPDQDILSIGKPLPNTQIYILNDNMQPLPIGVEGEIYVGGIGVARGYWNNAELTAEKFVANPFFSFDSENSLPFNRLYRTGDKGRWLANGELEFLGRVDTQVKIMGIRIELLEVENAIEQYFAIEKAAVITSKDKKHLVAFVLSSEGNIDLNQLRKFLEQILPSALIPSFFIILDKFPLTSNGKINKEELITYSIKKESLELKQDQLTTTGKIIFAAINDFVEVNDVDEHKNFLDIGLTSLDLVELSAKLSTLLKREVSVIDLFNYPTINTLANYLESLEEDNLVEEKLLLKKPLLNPRRLIKPPKIDFKNDENS